MSTGYTAKLATEGESFNAFVWRCARAFGALVHMRDEPGSAAIIPEIKPNESVLRSFERAREELAKARTMTLEEAEAEAQREYEAALKSHAENERKTDETRKRYEDMIANVEAWAPPTPEHSGLRNFMLEQLRESVRWDCGSKLPAPRKLAGAAWRSRNIEDCLRWYNSHEANWADEQKRARERTAWLQTLVSSVGNPPKSED